jgi:hypothetical protein
MSRLATRYTSYLVRIPLEKLQLDVTQTFQICCFFHFFTPSAISLLWYFYNVHGFTPMDSAGGNVGMKREMELHGHE